MNKRRYQETEIEEICVYGLGGWSLVKSAEAKAAVIGAWLARSEAESGGCGSTLGSGRERGDHEDFNH